MKMGRRRTRPWWLAAPDRSLNMNLAIEHTQRVACNHSALVTIGLLCPLRRRHSSSKMMLILH
jgi:hypothetical protein